VKLICPFPIWDVCNASCALAKEYYEEDEEEKRTVINYRCSISVIADSLERIANELSNRGGIL